MTRRLLAAPAALLAALLTALPVGAQVSYPTQAVTIVVPFGAGSGTDIGTRLIAQKMSESLGRPVVVSNKPGANGSIAAELVAKSKPDGHTLLMGTNSTHGANPALLKEMHYDPIRDFEHVNLVVIFTSIVVVNPGFPVASMRDLIAYGRANEIKLATGNASGIVQSETLARTVGWKSLMRVPYKSNPDAMTEVIAGRLDMMFSDIAAAQSQVRSGKLRALAVTSKSRSTIMPELPTVIESGVADFDLSGWIGLFAPGGTRREIVALLNGEVARVVQLPDVLARFREIGAEPNPMKPAEYAAWVQGEVTKWTKLAKDAGIQPGM